MIIAHTHWMGNCCGQMAAERAAELLELQRLLQLTTKTTGREPISVTQSVTYATGTYMLQIITGKFFTTDSLYVTRHRTVLYSNYKPDSTFVATRPGGVVSPKTLDTSVGSITSTTLRTAGGPFSWIYEVDEKHEAVRPDGTEEFMIGAGAEFLVPDFSAVASFALHAIFTTDSNVTSRLIGDQHTALGITHPPRDFVGRVFQSSIEIQERDGERLREFVDSLVGLNRNAYKAAIRAIRRYVNGLHRIADDLDLAYALLVASIESLAQRFDAFTPTWDDLEQNRRVAIDKALSPVPEEVASSVRQTLLAYEHVAIARRYREFALAHINPSFFREEAVGEVAPVRRSDLPRALERAYIFRSKYVHTLQELPNKLTAAPSHRDTDVIDGEPALTFHGLARLARHIIREFIERAPKCDREKFDYRKELPNIVHMRLAFSIWGHWNSSYDHKTGRQFLSGFLEEFTALLSNPTSQNPTLTDVRPLVAKVEALVPGLAKPEQRRPLLTLYYLFHRTVSAVDHRPNWHTFFEKYSDDFSEPSIESMLIHTIVEEIPAWPVEEFEATRQAYYKQRYNRYGLNLGFTLEAAVTLFLAEIHRLAGREEEARQLVSQAAEDLPGRASLMEFEQRVSAALMPAINWRELLLPARPEAIPDTDSSPSDRSTRIRLTPPPPAG